MAPSSLVLISNLQDATSMTEDDFVAMGKQAGKTLRVRTDTGLPSSSKQTGVVAKWVDARGFGFIQPDDGSEQVFVHYKALQDGRDSLTKGEKVQYVRGDFSPAVQLVAVALPVASLKLEHGILEDGSYLVGFLVPT